MEKKLDKLEEKIDKLDSRLDSIDKILVKNTDSLEYHIARTNKLEQYVEVELKPIKYHVALMSLGFKGVAWACSIATGLASFIYMAKKLGLF